MYGRGVNLSEVRGPRLPTRTATGGGAARDGAKPDVAYVNRMTAETRAGSRGARFADTGRDEAWALDDPDSDDTDDLDAEEEQFDSLGVRVPLSQTGLGVGVGLADADEDEARTGRGVYLSALGSGMEDPRVARAEEMAAQARDGGRGGSHLARGAPAQRARGLTPHYGGAPRSGAYVGRSPSKSELETASSYLSTASRRARDGRSQQYYAASSEAAEDAARDGLSTHPSRAVSHFLDALDKEHVNLRHRGVSAEASVAIAACLPENRCITSLDLSHNLFGDEGGATLVKALKHNEFIRVVDLSHNELGGRTADALLDALLDGEASLADLRLSNNALGGTIASRLAPALIASPSLTALDLSATELTERHAAAVAEVMMCPSLRSLNLAWNRLRGGCTAVFTAIEEAASSVHLTSLDVSFNGLDDACGVALARALAANSSLSEVDASHNRLESRAGLAIAEVLAENTTLRSLRLGYNKLGFDASIAIVAALEANTVLSELAVENTTGDGELGDEQVQLVWEKGQRIVDKRPSFARVTVEHPEMPRRLRKEGEKRKTVNEMIAEKTAEAWTLKRSIFAPRARECDARDFTDTRDVLVQAFNADWGHTKLPRVVKNPESLAAVKAIVRDRFPMIVETFRYYSALSVDPFSMAFNAFTEFRRDCDIDDTSKLADLDNVFVATNFEVDKNELNPAHSLTRYELVEAIVRLALVMYPPDPFVPGGESRAVRTLLDNHILPTMSAQLGIESADQMIANDFRTMRMYNEDVDRSLRAHEVELMLIFDRYSGKYSPPGTKKHFVSLDEWLTLLNDAHLFTRTFAERDAVLVFLWCNMVVIDEVERTKEDSKRDVAGMLTWVEFLEGICRLADSTAYDPETMTGKRSRSTTETDGKDGVDGAEGGDDKESADGGGGDSGAGAGAEAAAAVHDVGLSEFAVTSAPGDRGDGAAAPSGGPALGHTNLSTANPHIPLARKVRGFVAHLHSVLPAPARPGRGRK